jgi:hypothetical protein
MKILAEATQQTNASPKQIFEIWSDINNWSQFDESVEWAQLHEEFKAGSHFILKPKGGPKVTATIVSAEHNREFTNTSRMPGAVLKFAHNIIKKNGHVYVQVTISIEGPLSWLWAKILGKDQKRALEKSILNLVRLAEEKK